jgi:hypothetical protein
MYSEFISGLGLSQNTMEMIVFVGIIIAVIGVVLVLYWKYIVMGALAVGCVAVMANHKPVVSNVDKKEEVINQVKPVETPVEPVAKPSTTEPKDVRSEFMEKCINLADYTKTQCDELWDDRVSDERTLLEDTNFKGKKYGHYRKV